MSWCYRVRRRVFDTGEEYGIVECYDQYSWTVNNMTPSSLQDRDDSDAQKKGLDELRWQLTEMLKALAKPIIDYEVQSSTTSP
jgi:hypothetical protein